MRCKICDYCETTNNLPLNKEVVPYGNKVFIDPVGGDPICEECYSEVKETLNEMEPIEEVKE